MSHDDSTEASTKVSLTTFTIPKDSFTAFRLLYAPAHEVGEFAKVLYLGSIPAAWYGGKQYGLLSGSVKRAKKKMKRKLKSSYKVIDQSLRLTSEYPAWNSDYEDAKSTDRAWSDVDEISIDNQRHASEAIINGGLLVPPSFRYDNERENPLDEEDHGALRRESSHYTEEHGTTFNFDQHNEITFNQAIHGLETDEDLVITGDSDNPRFFRPNSPSPATEERDAENDDHLEEATIHTCTSAIDSNEEEMMLPILAPQATNLPESEPEEPLQVTFDSTAKPSKGSKMAFASPTPECGQDHQELANEYIKAKKNHLRKIKKLKKIGGFASNTGSKAKMKGSRVKLRVARRILSKFKPGEIVRVDRMLVQILRCDEYLLGSHFNEESIEKLKITDRWKEYNVVLRKSDEMLALLVVQFYDPKKGSTFDEKPEYKVRLGPEVKIGFYSNIDKTISISLEKEWGTRVVIMNARYEGVAHKWLFLVNEILEGTEECVFNITLPGLGQGIGIPFDTSMMKQLKQTLNDLEISRMEYGYHVSQCILQAYLRDKIYAKLNHATRFNEEVKNWLAENPDPWFCFKFYDRVEWIPQNSMVFYVMHKLMQKDYELQLRQISRPLLYIEDREGNRWTKPYPVEGFLGRATSTSGKEITKLRVFYKVSYFFTVENMLFFTKMFEGRPPSRTNTTRKSCEDEDEEDSMPPERFIKDPFEVDKHGHIPWINLPDFEERDKHIVEELERRIAQIIKAEGMVDLMQVKSVEPYPHKKLFTKQIYFHSLFWHANTSINTEEEVLDCALQIELHNGTKLRLMASSQAIRDEWIHKLRDLVAYHTMADRTRVVKATQTRKDNMEKLGINEYVDSNIVNEHYGFETPFAKPNEHIFDMSGLAMPLCVLMSGYLYQKHKKHANFGALYVVLCPGYLILFSLARRSKTTGMLKRRPCYEHYFTIPVSECFVYLGNQTVFDLVDFDNGSQERVSGRNQLPRIYPDGWKLCEEELQLCFTLWFGQKRKLRHQLEVASNPSMISMVRLLGMTGRSMVFMARSRVMREAWVTKLLQEINRFSSH